MSSTNRRTWHKFHVGHLAITVQLDSIAGGQQRETHQGLANVTRSLIAVLDAHRVPATWAVSDPAHSAATSLLLKSAVEHELAILGDANWVGPTAGRTRFARELVRRVTQARAAGLNVTTLVPGVARVDEHVDLVVKQRLTAVAGLSATTSIQLAQPKAVHYGVWEVPGSAKLPMRRTWFGSGQGKLWRRVRRTAEEAGTFHLVVDADAMAAGGQREVRTLDWLVARAATLRDRGLLHIETLRTAAERLSDVRTQSPQRSILRSAA